jgi:dienelactone hydrolase
MIRADRAKGQSFHAVEMAAQSKAVDGAAHGHDRSRGEGAAPLPGLPMMRRHLIAVAATLVSSAFAPAGAETVRVQSGSYTDFRQLLSGQPAVAPVTIDATLAFPEEKRDRYPAIVIVHAIAGYQDQNEGWHAAEFRKAGFATLTYNSPAAGLMRRPTPFVSSGGPPWGSAVAEAYGALRLLAGDPRIDATRIAIVGFSFGGEVAHLAAFERLRAALAPGQLRFAAHVAYYPAGVFGASAEPRAYTGAPILMLLGERDDNLPIAKADGYLGYARGAGRAPPIDVSIYRGAYHAWTVPSLGSPRFYEQYESARKCPYILLGPGRNALLVDGQERPFEPESLRACLKDGRGYTMAYDSPARTRALEESMGFLLKAVRR